MSCDLTDPSIAEAYQQILAGEISWLVLGYRDTREKLSLYSKGTGGVEELKDEMIDPIIYALLLYNDHLIYIVYVDEKLSGVRRARTVVHGRAVAAFFEQLDVNIYVNKLENLTQESIDAQIANKGANPTNGFTVPPEEDDQTPRPTTKDLPNPATRLELPETDLIRTNSIPGYAVSEEEETEDAHPFFNPNSSNFHQSTPLLEEESALPMSPSKNKLFEEEAKRKIQEAWEKRQSVRVQFDHNQTSADSKEISGYLTIQGDGCYFWKRRWYVLRGDTLYFYRDSSDHYPVSCLDLGGAELKVEDCTFETLIPNSFRLSLNRNQSTDIYNFFSDTPQQMDLAIQSIQSSILA